MDSDRTVHHVVPHASGDRWVVSIENDQGRREKYRTDEEAVQAAKRRVRGQEPAQVKVHKSDGNMEHESTHGEDPRRSPS